MLEYNAGENDSKDLPDSHDDHENDGPKGADGVVNEELPTGRTDGQNDAVQQEPGVLRHKHQGCVEDSLLQK